MTKHRDETIDSIVAKLKKRGVAELDSLAHLFNAVYNSGFNEAVRALSKRMPTSVENNLSAISNSLYNCHIKNKPPAAAAHEQQRNHSKP
jgi:hypothetical protein